MYLQSPILKELFSLFEATVDTFPGAYLLIVAALALLNSALLFSVRWGLSKSDALRELDEANQRLREDLLPKGDRPQRPENTKVSENVGAHDFLPHR